jgi:2-polyprenyl-6-hydroxyphenyl methylase/3-demethylubiquinone-9 3-methyltransferase
MQKTTINIEEVEKFSRIADEWWDEKGKFKPLHKFNPVRLEFIIKQICEHFGKNFDDGKSLSGLKILDIGCGGGLLSAPQARLGAEVTGIDASEKNIKTAIAYATNKNIEIEYLNTTAEELANTGRKFDIVLNMEVIEHVDNVELFMKSSSELLAYNGLMFVATLNRTLKSFAFGIIGAEYILKWLPKGTHDWKKFLKPYEIVKFFEKNDLKLKTSTGVSYNPFTDKFSLSDDLNMNYILVATPQS